MAAINIDVGANTRQAERDIQKLVNKAYTINLKTKGDQPLGRITGQVNEFTKSLDASNARVIAFGASAGIIFGVQRAFEALASSVIDTQKALADINVILNVSSAELSKFGSSLFSIAKNTGQSFQEVAKAATEFSRQGLGVEETLKRTNEALILSRLSGLDAAKSVEALTASVNSFANQAVTATEIVNKFANVDAAFAVSSADLAEAISRVGSSAAQSGVSLNELIAIVTSAQQTTARGGAVIGNSFKTIFTRLQRTQVIDLLEGLGIDTRDASGEIKSTINLLTDLAKVYDQLGTLQQAEVAEKVGGVFQINILKAALADLGKEFSVYNNALQVAASTTDQAIRRNEELNKTYAAQLNALQENAKQLGAGIGERLFGPAFDRVIGNANEILGGINESDGQGVGAVLGKGILDGLGQVIAGPGLALIGGIFIKLFSDLSKFATGSIKELLGLNTASKQQQALQQSIAAILQKNPELFKLMQQGTAGVNKGAEILLNNLRAQTAELRTQETIAAKIAAQFIKSGSVRIAGGVPVAPPARKAGKAAGYIPNFAEEFQAKEFGATPSVKAVRGVGKIGGKSFEANNQEFQFKNFAGTGETAVIPTYGNGIKEAAKMIARGESGSILDKSDRNKAKGFIPNFAIKSSKNTESPKNIGSINLNDYIPEAPSRYGVLYPSGGTKGTFTQRLKDMAVFKALKIDGTASVTLPSKSVYPIDPAEIKDTEALFNQDLDTYLSQGMTNLAAEISKTIQGQSKGEITASVNPVSASTLPQGAKGSIFETSVKAATRDLKVNAKEGSNDFFDFDPIGAYPVLAKLFGFTALKSSAVEAKIGEGAAKNIPNKVLNKRPDVRNKILKQYELDKPKKVSKGPTEKELRERGLLGGYRKKAFAGYIPNFVAQMKKDAIGKESRAGVPKSKMYFSQEKALADANSLSLGLFNTVDEPNQKSRDIAMRNQGFAAKGYIPNFAAEDTAPTDPGATLAALSAQLLGIGLLFQGSGQQYKSSLEEIIQRNKEQGRVTGELTKAQKAANTQLVAMGKITAEEAKARGQAGRYGATRGQKIGAALGANAIGIGFAAPILAETIANAIGEQTKEARTGGAAVSAVGQAASFAAFGSMFGPWGTAIGAATGLTLGFANVIKQASTDIPEMAEAARKASENLTRINDAGQKVQTSFEQIKQLRESGQAEKAGELEAELLSFIRKEFKDTPQFSAELQTAVINQDTKALQDAIGQNTQAVLKNTQQQERNLLITQFIENLSGKEAPQQLEDIIKIQDLTPENLNKLLEFIKKAETTSAITFPEASGSGVVGPTPKISEDAKKLTEELKSLLISIGITEGEAAILAAAFQNDPSAAIEIFKKLKDPASKYLEAIQAAARNTAAGNPVIDQITKILNNIKSTYSNFDKQLRTALETQLLAASLQTGITQTAQAESLRTGAVMDELFGVSVSPKEDKNTLAKLKELDNTFEKSINDGVLEITGVIQTDLLDQIKSVIEKSTEIGKDDTAQTNAENNLKEVTELIKDFLTEESKIQLEQGGNIDLAALNTELLDKFKDIFKVDDLENFTGFNVEDKLNEIADELKIPKDTPEGQKRLEVIRAAIDKTNQEILKAKAVLVEQKIILANQKFQENLRALITAVNSSFGGLKSFLDPENDVTSFSKFEEAIANLRIIGEADGTGSMIGVARNLQTVISELSSILGMNLGEALGPDSQIIKDITVGRSLDIERKLTSVFENIVKLGGERSDEFIGGLQETLRKLGGLTEEEIQGLSIPELIKAVADAIAKQQVDSENRTGEVNERYAEAAREMLPDSLKGFLGTPDLQSFESQVSAGFITANETLKKILQALGGDVEGVVNATLPSASNQNTDIPSNARGSIPTKAIPAMIAETGAIKNGVGGALPTDRPEILRNFNGKMIVANSGEKRIKNFMGTGQDALLTREMQNAAEGSLPIDDYLNELKTRGGISSGSLSVTQTNTSGSFIDIIKGFVQKLGVQNMAEGFIPEPEIPYDLIKEANELNKEAAKKLDPIQNSLDRQFSYRDELENQEREDFYKYMEQTRGYNKDQSEKVWNDTLKSTGSYVFGQEEVAKLKEAYGWESPVRNEIEKIYDAENTLSIIKNQAKDEFRTASQSLRQKFENIGVDPNSFLRPGISLETLFARQKEYNEPRRKDRLAAMAAQRAEKEKKRREQSQAFIKRSRERLARSYEMTGDRYDIDPMGFGTDSKAFTVDAQRLGLKGAGAGGTFYGADMVDRAGLEGPKAIPRAIRTSQASAKYMLESLAEAYREAAANQENYYSNRPLRESMDQKRALMSKVQEFKNLYDQGRYESLREVYESHKKIDPIKEALDAQKESTSTKPSDEEIKNKISKLEELTQAIKVQGAEPIAYVGDKAGYEDYLRKRAEEVGVEWYSKGYLPNMDIEMENARINSFMQEVAAGFSPKDVYQRKQPEVQGLDNPQGFASFNNVQEGNIIRERIAMNNGMYAPNFANAIQQSTPSSINLGGITINDANTGGNTQDYAEDFAKEWELRAGALANQIKIEIDAKYRSVVETVNTAVRQKTLPNIPPRSNR